jgi:hypothetical protein
MIPARRMVAGRQSATRDHLMSEKELQLMSVTNRRLIFVVGLALVIALSVAGFTTRATAQGNAGGRVRFVHGLPGGSAVDITIDKVVAIRALGFASASRHRQASTR